MARHTEDNLQHRDFAHQHLDMAGRFLELAQPDDVDPIAAAQIHALLAIAQALTDLACDGIETWEQTS